MERDDVIVIGAGIGGLAAALELARAGRGVAVLERAGQPGGRAKTQEREGFSWNLGPHALYSAGAAAESLRRLKIEVEGGVPPTRGQVVRDGRLHLLPGDPLSLLRTTLVQGGERLALARGVMGAAAWPLPDPEQSVSAWLGDLAPPAADTILALIRVSTYCNAPDRLPARVALRQLRLALRGVRYLHGGWRQLVDALTRAVEGAGVHVGLGADVVGLERVGEGWRVTRADGAERMAADVVLAVPPAAAAKLGVSLPPLTPVRAACLDLGLESKPEGASDLVFGVDQPLYLSNHSAVARLCERGVVVHVARYLAPEDDGRDAEGELEGLLDLAWPGWRDRVHARRFQPALVVSHAMPEVGHARPAPDLGDGRWLVGDWVGEGSLLADASFASAAAVARGILARRARSAA